MGNRIVGGLLALGLLGGVALPGEALGTGIHRRSIYAIYSTWQSPYQNAEEAPQRVLLRTSGSWSYSKTDIATAAGVPWNKELRKKTEGLLTDACAPFSLVGKLEREGQEPELVCLGDDGDLMLPPGATLSFAINEAEGQHGDNGGVIRLEILVSDRRGLLVP